VNLKVILFFFSLSLCFVFCRERPTDAEPDYIPYENRHSRLYSLTPIMNCAALDGKIAGIAYDGQCLWIATHLPQGDGGIQSDFQVKLFQCYNEKGEIHVIVTFEYQTVAERPSGLTWDGNYLWLNFTAWNSSIKKIDPKDGRIINKWSSYSWVNDLSYNGNYLLLSTFWNTIKVIDPKKFSPLDDLYNPLESGANFGIACRPGEIWLSNWDCDYLAVLDSTGKYIGTAEGDVLKTYRWYYTYPYICFMDDKLAITFESRIYILKIERNLKHTGIMPSDRSPVPADFSPQVGTLGRSGNTQ
jgi:hypothetical protein